MQWTGDRTAVANVATGTVIKIVSDGHSRRLRYGLLMLLITATTGLTLTMSALVGRPVFALMLVPVLAVAFGRGLWPALATLVLAGALIITLTLPPIGMPWLNDPVQVGALGLLVAEGATLAFIGAVVRATLRSALSTEHLAGAATRQAGAATQQEGECLRPVGAYLAEHLTPRETEVLRMAADGRNVDELAAELSVSPNTVKTHLAHCYGKLGAHNRAEAVALGVQSGVLRTVDLNEASGPTFSATPQLT
jgi:DNA-binding CsgD family transcriptional regulator